MIIAADKLITKAGTPPLTDGGIVVRNSRIQDIGSTSYLVKKYRGYRVARLENAVLLPGLVNLHTHLELPPLMDRIRAADYPGWVLNLLRAKRTLSGKDYRDATRKNIETLVATGTTTAAEICTHGMSPEALKRSGLRAVVYREIISMEQDPRRVSLPRVGRSSQRIRFGLSPHSPHTVSLPALKAVGRFAAARALPLCMHVAETIDEVRLFRQKKSGIARIFEAAGWDRAWIPEAPSPVAYLERIGVLRTGFLAVHAVHIDDLDIARIRKAGAAVAHCPRSNREFGNRAMPLAKLLAAGVPVGLGTDSLASSPSLSLWDEMRYAYRVHRSSGISCRRILSLSTSGGARALGLDQEIGSLEPGKRADVIAVPLPKRNTGDLCSDLLRETESCIMTMVNGNIIYRLKGIRMK